MVEQMNPDPLMIDRSSTTDRVAARLRRALFDGGLAPGTALRESDVSRRLGVSRGTLREALRVLEAEGLLSREPNRGVVVKLLTPADLADLYHARRVIETGAVEAIELPPSPERAAPLHAALEAYAVALDGHDEQAITDAHIAFHVEVVALSGNRRLRQVAAALLGEMRLALAAADRRHHDAAHQLAAHWTLIDALAAGDARLVAAALSDHTRDALVTLLDATSGEDVGPGPGSVTGLGDDGPGGGDGGPDDRAEDDAGDGDRAEGDAGDRAEGEPGDRGNSAGTGRSRRR
jgi:DNA-binding GntR family transcriptional regulator